MQVSQLHENIVVELWRNPGNVDLHVLRRWNPRTIVNTDADKDQGHYSHHVANFRHHHSCLTRRQPQREQSRIGEERATGNA